jgi:hypothetical protein
MSQTYSNFLAADRRLRTLCVLEQVGAFGANHEVIHDCLVPLGHSASHDLVKTDLAWLAEQGLVTLSQADGMTVAKLTTRGFDCTQGTAVVPGVKRPTPQG